MRSRPSYVNHETDELSTFKRSTTVNLGRWSIAALPGLYCNGQFDSYCAVLRWHVGELDPERESDVGVVGDSSDALKHPHPSFAIERRTFEHTIMARFSRDKSRTIRSTVSPWMTAFYICAILLAPMLFMGMIPSAKAQDAEPAKDAAVSGPGELSPPTLRVNQTSTWPSADRRPRSSHRLIGRKFDERDVQRDMKHFPFKVINKGGQPRVKVDVSGAEKTFTPEEVSSMILGKMKEVAESYLGEKVNDEDGLGGKIDEDEKETLLEAIKEATDWLEENSATATADDFEEQKQKLSDVAYPITSKLYEGGAGGMPDYDDEPSGHEEL
nr:78 kda glucose-regulated protein like [Quercus suber]